MSHGTSPVTRDDVPAIVRAEPVSLGLFSRLFLGLLLLIGVLAFLGELFAGDPKKAWMSLHISVTYWICVGAASSCFAAVFHICNAQWVRPIQRLFEAGIPFFRITPLFLVVMYFGHEHLFIWAREAVHGKEMWLSSKFLFIRDVLALSLLAYLAHLICTLSVRKDILAIRAGLTGLSEDDVKRWKSPTYDCYVSESDSDIQKEFKKTQLRMSRLSPTIVIVYALVMSLIAFDQLMSVDPHWYSTLFGALYFMSAVYLAVAFAAMGVSVVRAHSPLFVAKIERRTLHDLGKLLFGFGIFWMYMMWSHYLPMWYGNLPEETAFLISRVREQPWHSIAWIVVGMCFIVPFLLGLNRDLKQVPSLLFATAMIPAMGVWLLIYLIFAPSLYPKELPFSLGDVAIFLGFLSGYVLLAVRHLSKVPLMPFGDFFQLHKE